jgi:hypothetical protein
MFSMNHRITGTYRELIIRVSGRIRDPNQHPKLFQFGALTVDLNSARPFGP